MGGLDPISVIIPTYNEEKTIASCIESLLQGSYPRDKVEFIVADGMSTDTTREQIKKLKKRYPSLNLRVLDNPRQTQGFGLNIAIENCRSDSKFIVRIDAHSKYPQNYLMECVEAARRSNADNVGGVMMPIGRTFFQKVVAFCMSNVLGVGDSRYHLGNFSGPVDTVYIGCYKRSIFERVGLFDPMMTPNEDAELNLRITRSGGVVYLDSNLRILYYPRDTLWKLIRQYFRYGQGRCRTIKKHRQVTSVRQVIPPLWVVGSFICLVASFFSSYFLIPIMCYVSVNIVVSVMAFLKRRDVSLLLAPVAFVSMHYSWGVGFFSELLKKRERDYCA